MSSFRLKIASLFALAMCHFSSAFAVDFPNKPRVLIVGAGPAGLSVAKALQNRGIYPEIIEKESHIRSDGAGIKIPANASWALDQLGIDLASKARLIRSMKFTDDQGELLIQENIEAIHPEGAQFYSLSRDELMKILLGALHSQTKIQTALTVDHFSEEEDRVKVEFSDGRVNYYDWVIGCDGVHSSLRKQVHPNESPEFLGLLVWRCIVDGSHGVELPTYMIGRDRTALLYPLPNEKTDVYGQVFQSVKAAPTASFSEEFFSFGGQVPVVLSHLKETAFLIHHMEKSHSVRFKLEGFKRVLLVGDAAHAFGPMLQNGAAQAFEDAYVIQELLKDQKEIPSLIDAFENRRLARVNTIYTISCAKIQALSDPKQIQGRNEAIRKSGAPNVQAFKLIMKQNP